jgi:hypothetical protein
MSLIEDQQREIKAQIDQARQSARRAEQAAESQRAIYKWSKDNPSWACEANLQIMQSYLANAGIQISEDSLDLAKGACRHQLAERVPTPVLPELTAEEKVRAENARLQSLSREELREEIRSGIKRKLASPEYGGYGSTYVPNFTATEFLKMSTSQVKALLHYPGSNQERPGVRAGIDKLLRDAQLLKDATN